MKTNNQNAQSSKTPKQKASGVQRRSKVSTTRIVSSQKNRPYNKMSDKEKRKELEFQLNFFKEDADEVVGVWKTSYDKLMAEKEKKMEEGKQLKKQLRETNRHHKIESAKKLKKIHESEEKAMDAEAALKDSELKLSAAEDMISDLRKKLEKAEKNLENRNEQGSSLPRPSETEAIIIGQDVERTGLNEPGIQDFEVDVDSERRNAVELHNEKELEAAEHRANTARLHLKDAQEELKANEDTLRETEIELDSIRRRKVEFETMLRGHAAKTTQCRRTDTVVENHLRNSKQIESYNRSIENLTRSVRRGVDQVEVSKQGVEAAERAEELAEQHVQTLKNFNAVM